MPQVRAPSYNVRSIHFSGFGALTWAEGPLQWAERNPGLAPTTYGIARPASQLAKLVACRREFVTADAAGGVGVFPLDRSGVGGISVDVAAEFAS